MAEVDGHRLFQLSVDTAASSPEPAVRQQVFDRLQRVAVDIGVPVTFGIISPGDQYRWRGLLDLIDSTNAAGGYMFGQSLPREATLILSFLTRLPFDRLKEWAEIRTLPLEAQRAMLLDPAIRQHLVEAARHGEYVDSIGATIRPPDWDRIRLFRDPTGPNPTINAIAGERGTDPIETFIDLALEADLGQFFTQAVGNPDEDEVLTMLRHPRMIPTFSDSGAHVGYIMESSIQSYVLSYWVRRRAGADVRGSDPQDDPRAGDRMGLRRSGPGPSGLRRRPQHHRPGHRRPCGIVGRRRPTRRRLPTQAGRDGVQGDDRRW